MHKKSLSPNPLKFSFRYYFHPTPARIKKIADSLLVAIGGGGSAAVLTDFHPKLGATFAVFAIAAKFISQCFKES
jgi:hypothetical protein